MRAVSDGWTLPPNPSDASPRPVRPLFVVRRRKIHLVRSVAFTRNTCMAVILRFDSAAERRGKNGRVLPSSICRRVRELISIVLALIQDTVFTELRVKPVRPDSLYRNR